MPNFLETIGAGYEEAQRIKRRDQFENLPRFDLPPAPGFGRGFDNPFGVFTDFQPTGGIDESIMNLLRQKAERDTITGFIPDQADFDANLAAQMDEIFARAGVTREQLAARFGKQGITQAGEVNRVLLRDVQGPALRAAATVSAQAQLAFQQQVQTGAIAQEGALGASRGQLLDAAKANAQMASTEAQFGANLESNERMAANRNALQKAIADDSITLEVYKVQLSAQLSEYLSHMDFLTATEVAEIRGRWAAEAARIANKRDGFQKWADFARGLKDLFSIDLPGGE